MDAGIEQLVTGPILPDIETLNAITDAIVETQRKASALRAQEVRLYAAADAWRAAAAANAPETQRTSEGWNAAAVAGRTISSEIAAALRVHERTVQRLMFEGTMLSDDLPKTLDALADGAISYRHVQRILDNAQPLEAEDRRSLDAFLHPKAATQSPAQVERRARTRVARMHPEALVAKKQLVFGDRGVSIRPDNDGMGWLNAYLPAETLVGIDHRMTELARDAKAADESRTIGQLRADVLADLLMSGESESLAKGVSAKVMVTVPVLTLLGLSEEPADLEGWGPIDPETAKRLAAHAPSFTRILTHPETGVVKSVGRDSYRVPADLRNWIAARDQTCRFPGCTASILTGEIDHTVDFHGPDDGITSDDNLCYLCRLHHHLKHNTRWKVEQIEPGLFRWTSPGEKEYLLRPEPPWAA